MATDVSSLITSAQNTAKELATESATMVDRALSAFDVRYELIPGDLALNFTDVNLDVGEVPQYQGAQFEAPQTPGAAPETLPLPTLELGEAPGLGAVKPTFVLPSTPSELQGFEGVAPTMSALYVPPAPDALSNLNIEPPTLTEIVVPAVPQVALPEFDAQRPDTDLQAPTDFVAQYRLDFRDQGVALRNDLEGAVDAYIAKINPRFTEQMAAIEDRLAAYIRGGSGLTPAVEDAIYGRALDKTNIEYLRTRDTIYEDSARRGFTLPTGAVLSAVTQARQAAADNNARAAMDIALKQAELEQNNLQFAVTQSMQLRQMVIGASQQWAGNLVQLNAQALQFAQGVLQATVELYDIKVKIVQARVEIYRAEAQVYEYRLKAVLAAYDVFKSQVDALRAQVDVDVARVQAFTSQVNAYGALANAYKAVIDGVATKAQIEKLRVEAFGAEVQAYSAKVAGKTAEWQGFRAQVEGEVAKVDAYKAEVQAYGQEVEAFKTKVQAKAAQIQAVGQTNESAARTYTASVQAYTALVQGQSAAVQAEIQSFDSTLKAFTAGASVKEAEARIKVENIRSSGQVAVSAYAQQANVAIANAQMNYKRSSDVANVAVSGANVYASMTSSALAGMNSMAAAIEQYSL